MPPHSCSSRLWQRHSRCRRATPACGAPKPIRIDGRIDDPAFDHQRVTREADYSFPPGPFVVPKHGLVQYVVGELGRTLLSDPPDHELASRDAEVRSFETRDETGAGA